MFLPNREFGKIGSEIGKMAAETGQIFSPKSEQEKSLVLDPDMGRINR